MTKLIFAFAVMLSVCLEAKNGVLTGLNKLKYFQKQSKVQRLINHKTYGPVCSVSQAGGGPLRDFLVRIFVLSQMPSLEIQERHMALFCIIRPRLEHRYKLRFDVFAPSGWATLITDAESCFQTSCTIIKLHGVTSQRTIP
jgi:hypothetical protein